MRKFLAVATAALFPLAAAGLADTLVTRDGSSHPGQFVSGNGNTIVFQEDHGGRRTYNVRDVRSIEFDSTTAGRMNQGTRIRTDSAVGSERSIPAGTDLVVRTNENIESTSASEGRSYSATVDRDILDQSGNVLVPHGSDAELVVRDVNQGGRTGSPELVLDLQSIKVGDQRYLVSGPSVERRNEQGLGRNRRTAEMVGGGAVLGTVLGAIAGGGKGAAIGAIAGAAAGAGAQVLTRGKEVKVPAETQLTFRLDKPVNLVPARK